jgi:hypothetical protein
MAFPPPLRFVPYEQATTPNVVVDGSPNDSTVLTLSHWPGSPTPDALGRDLSAEIAFAYLDDPSCWVDAAAVTNNHFDQDGLVSAFALVEPELATTHRDLLIDVAAAGDFGTYRDRRAARASMVIAAWCQTGLSYDTALARLLALVLDPEPYRDVWATEDAHLTASEAAIDDGRIVISELDELDLAVVTVADGPSGTAHRFAHQTFEGVHPMALHNATDRFRLLVVREGRFRYVDRYETWVRFRSRPTLPRVDMRPLAVRLNELDTTTWTAEAPGALAPSLGHDGRSGLAPEAVIEIVTDHLITATGVADRRS